MGKIEENRQKLQQGIAMGTLTPVEAPEYKAPSGLPGPGDTKNPAATPFLRTAIPAGFQLGTDTFRAFQKNTLPGVRIAPLPASLDKNIGASAKSQIIVNQNTGNAVVFEVKGSKVPNQNLVNFIPAGGLTITPDAFGGLIFNATATGDGLTHGTTPWEIDPSSFVLQDDFFSFQEAATTTAPTSGIGQLGWRIVNSNGLQTTGGYVQGVSINDLPAGMGCFVMCTGTTSQQGGLLHMNWSNGGFGALAAGQGAWPILDQPGWKCTWVFKHDVGHAPTAGAFLAAGHSTYIGLFGPNEASQMNGGTNTSRPAVFCGLGYDTSGYYISTFNQYTNCTAVTMSGSNMAITGTFTGANTTPGTTWVGLTFVCSGFGNSNNNGAFICTAATTTTLTLTNPNGVNAAAQTGTVKSNTPCVCTAVANASAGNTTYTGTFPNVTSVKGQTVTISGFGNAANNGTFTVVSQSSGTTLVVNNPSGVAETHAGFIAGPGLFDTTYVLEYVVNPSTAASSNRNNTQGQTSVLAVGPAVPGTWHRLDIICTSNGSITMTLDGANTFTPTVTKYTQVFNGALGLNAALTLPPGNPDNSLNIITISSSDSFPFNSQFPVAMGSKVTIAGLTGAGIPFNGTWNVIIGSTWGSTLNLSLGPLNHAAIGSIQQSGAGISVSAFPAFTPGAFYGTDISTPANADTMSFWIDYFGFAWNPALSSNAPGTPDPTKARYW